MATKISHVKLRVQIEEKPPQELIEAYINGFMKSPDKAYKRLREAVPDIDTVIEKIIKPGIKGSKDLFKPDAVTTTGQKIKDIPMPTLADMEKWAKRWFKKTKHAHRYDSKEYLESIKNMAGFWAKTMLSTLAIKGFKDKIRGVGPIAASWLTGALTVLEKINRKEIIEGEPFDIIRAGYGGTFRKTFNSKIVSVGRPVIAKKYQPGDIIYANEQINRLVNAFALNKFVRFTPGGDSRVDFIREDRQLFLEIVVSTTQ